VSMISGGRTVKVRPRTDYLTTPGSQIAKPIRLLAVEQRDDESPVVSECKERRSIVAARASTAVEDDCPRGRSQA
jgi:hypothetical protein